MSGTSPTYEWVICAPYAGASSIFSLVWYFPLIVLCASNRAAEIIDVAICRQRSAIPCLSPIPDPGHLLQDQNQSSRQ